MMELLQDSLAKAKANGMAKAVAVSSCINAIERMRMAKLEMIMWITGGHHQRKFVLNQSDGVPSD
jgi:hypothetical protein